MASVVKTAPTSLSTEDAAEGDALKLSLIAGSATSASGGSKKKLSAKLREESDEEREARRERLKTIVMQQDRSKPSRPKKKSSAGSKATGERIRQAPLISRKDPEKLSLARRRRLQAISSEVRTEIEAESIDTPQFAARRELPEVFSMWVTKVDGVPPIGFGPKTRSVQLASSSSEPRLLVSAAPPTISAELPLVSHRMPAERAHKLSASSSADFLHRAQEVRFQRTHWASDLPGHVAENPVTV